MYLYMHDIAYNLIEVVPGSAIFSPAENFQAAENIA